MASDTTTATETEEKTEAAAAPEVAPDEDRTGDTTAEQTDDTDRETGTGTGAAPVGGTSGAGRARTSDGAVLGAGALVSAALGFASITGTSLSEMLRAREELLGQIAAVTGGGGADQIETLYGGPWHTAALVNGVFAVVAALLGAVLAFGPARKPTAPAWGRALALGGFVLGVVGLLVSGGMYLDLFAAAPQLPAMPGMPG